MSPLQCNLICNSTYQTLQQTPCQNPVINHTDLAPSLQHQQLMEINLHHIIHYHCITIICSNHNPFHNISLQPFAANPITNVKPAILAADHSNETMIKPCTKLNINLTKPCHQVKHEHEQTCNCSKEGQLVHCIKTEQVI